MTGVERDATMIAAARDALAGQPEGIRERMRIVEGDGRDTGVHFLPGSFDVVLCHGVLMYVEGPTRCSPGWPGCSPRADCCRSWCANGDALAMRPGLRGDLAETLAAFDTTVCRDGGGIEIRADRRATLTAKLASIGAPLHTWYGVRVFTDTAPDDARVPDGLETLLAAEERAGRTDPYRQIAALLHLCGVRG